MKLDPRLTMSSADLATQLALLKRLGAALERLAAEPAKTGSAPPRWRGSLEGKLLQLYGIIEGAGRRADPAGRCRRRRAGGEVVENLRYGARTRDGTGAASMAAMRFRLASAASRRLRYVLFSHQNHHAPKAFRSAIASSALQWSTRIR